jgi:hypothetical protein
MNNRYSPAAILGAMLVLSLPPCAAAQNSTRTPAQQPATAAPVNQTQPSLNEAREALTALPAATEGALDDLRRDFESLRSMFAAQNTGTEAAAAGEGRGTTHDASKGAPSGVKGAGVAGTSGLPGSAAANDWRPQYALVNSDLSALWAATGCDSDAVKGNLRVSIKEFRERLENFRVSAQGPALASAPPATAPPYQSSSSPSQSSSSVTAQPSEAPSPTRAAPNTEAIGLLQRVHELLGHYHDDGGRNLKLAGKVTMERADIDEIAAEVQELELMLQK